MRKPWAAAGDQLSFSRSGSEGRPWAGRRPVQGGAPVGGGLRARPSWLWALGRPFHLLSLCLLWEDRKSPPLPAGLRSGASEQRHSGGRILEGPHLLPLSKQQTPCDQTP